MSDEAGKSGHAGLVTVVLALSALAGTVVGYLEKKDARRAEISKAAAAWDTREITGIKETLARIEANCGGARGE